MEATISESDMHSVGKIITEIPPKGCMKQMIEEVVDATMDQIKRGEKHVHIVVFLSYDDIFEKERQRTGWMAGTFTGMPEYFAAVEGGAETVPPVRIEWNRLPEANS